MNAMPTEHLIAAGLVLGAAGAAALLARRTDAAAQTGSTPPTSSSGATTTTTAGQASPEPGIPLSEYLDPTTTPGYTPPAWSTPNLPPSTPPPPISATMPAPASSPQAPPTSTTPRVTVSGRDGTVPLPPGIPTGYGLVAGVLVCIHAGAVSSCPADLDVVALTSPDPSPAGTAKVGAVSGPTTWQMALPAGEYWLGAMSNAAWGYTMMALNQVVSVEAGKCTLADLTVELPV